MEKQVVQKNGEVYLNTIERWREKKFLKKKRTRWYWQYDDISDKLNVLKFPRLKRNKISENVKSYIQVIKNKFRNLKTYVILRYKRKNNLNKNQLRSLKKLNLKTQNKDIEVGYSDKDGKTIIIDYDD